MSNDNANAAVRQPSTPDLRSHDDTMSENIMYGLLGCVLCLALVISLTLCIWTLDRGFDITDESNSLLLAMQPTSFRIFVSAAVWPTSYLWSITGSLAAYRATGLAIIVLSSIVLAIGASRAAIKHNLSHDNFVTKWATGLSAICAALHWDTYGVSVFFTPFYNLLSVSGSYATVGLLLLLADIDLTAVRFALTVLAGFSLGIVLLCKFPTGINLIVLICVISIVHNNTLREKLSFVALVTTSAVATAVLIAWAQMPLDAVVSNFRLGLQFYHTALPESTTTRLARNAAELLIEWKHTITAFFVPLAIFAAYIWCRRPPVQIAALATMFIVLISGGYLLADPDLMASSDHLGTQVRSLAALLVAGCLVTLPCARINLKQWIILLCLFSLPYAISFGTANNLPLQVITSIAPWAVLLGIMSQAYNISSDRRLTAVAVLTMFTVAAAAQVSASVFTGAYHVDQPLAEQSNIVTIGAIGTVRVDDATRSFVHDMDRAGAKCDIKQYAPFIGLYNIPGVAIILKVRPILTTWLIDASQAQPWLALAPQAEIKAAVVGLQIQPDGNLPSIPPALGDFPSGYHFCGEGMYPYRNQRIQIWAPT